MVLPSRPSLRTTGRRFPEKLSPASPDHHVTSPTTRSNKIPLRPAPDLSSDGPTHQLHAAEAFTDAVPRKATRARSDDAAGSPAPSSDEAALPPTIVAVTQPYGELLRTANGSQKRLKLAEDDNASQASTPRPDSVNGARPAANGASKAESRTLRSKDVGSRLKSELSKFFPEYDDVMNDVPESPEFLKLEEPILITNEPLRHTDPKAPSHTPQSQQPTAHHSKPIAKSKSRAEPSSVQNAKTISVGLQSASQPSKTDPLPDELYFKPHRRKENAEKRLRNREKENALHEKTQLERLMNDLQGPDWLRVLGVTGVTEGERRGFDSKRAYFINEVKVLLEKFRKWKEEEKRLKTEREEALARQEEEDDESGAEDEDEDASRSDGASSGPNSSDLDAGAAQQLLFEAIQASGGTRPKGKGRARKDKRSASRQHADEDDEDDDLSPTRGVKRPRRPSDVIFGVPIPDSRTRDFTLPPSWISPEALRANARKRRKLNRDMQQEQREKGAPAV